MARLVIELTNRCNLCCLHCFTERHAATGDLPLTILDQVLHEGKGCGIDHLAFTGGEPTIHRQFDADPCSMAGREADMRGHPGRRGQSDGCCGDSLPVRSVCPPWFCI